jgi:hypothetical protein
MFIQQPSLLLDRRLSHVILRLKLKCIWPKINLQLDEEYICQQSVGPTVCSMRKGHL